MDSRIEACITDANVFIDLYRSNILAKVCGLADLSTTDLVAGKMREPSTEKMLELGVEVLSLDSSQMVHLSSLSLKYSKPSPDDLSALIMAKDRALVLLTGDGDLRNAAKSLGLVVHGTLWLLDELVNRDLFNNKEAYAALSLMVANKRRLPEGEVKKRLIDWQ